MRGKYSTGCLESVREKYVEQKKSYAESTRKSYEIKEARALLRKRGIVGIGNCRQLSQENCNTVLEHVS